MNDNDLQKYLRSLESLDVDLPRHQQKLRRLLIASHTPQQTISSRFRGAFMSLKQGDTSMKKYTKALSISTAVASALVLVVVAITTMSSQPVAAEQILNDATKKANQMSPAEVEKINAQYRQDINQRLNEARQSNSLRLLTTSEVSGFTPVEKADPMIKKYLSYTDTQGHRIIIGLDAANEPLVLFDADALSGAPAANDASSSSAPKPVN